MASKPLPSRATGLLGATNCTPDDVYMTIWKRKTVSKTSEYPHGLRGEKSENHMKKPFSLLPLEMSCLRMSLADAGGVLLRGAV